MSAEVNDDALKVAYIYNITKFTRWPDSSWTDRRDPFILCFYGEDSVSRSLSKLQNKKINDHLIKLLKVENDHDFKSCNALYIDTQDRRRYRYLLSQINQKIVLVITDHSPFFNAGGLINLVEKDKRLRFQVSQKQLSISQLKLSSKLLKLAILVDDLR